MIRVDPHDPRLMAAGPLAAWLHCRAIAWCAEHRTAGVIPALVVEALIPEIAVPTWGDDNEIDQLECTLRVPALVRMLIVANLWVAKGRDEFMVLGFTNHVDPLDRAGGA